MAVCFFTSCTSTKQVIYFNDLNDSTAKTIKTAQENFENPIQKNDQLWISVGGSNISDLPALNSGNGMGLGSGNALTAGSSGAALGYLVEADGKIQVPYIGKVQAEGVTRIQFEQKLTELFKDYTKDPIVNVRFLNYNFSILGEVSRSGRYNMPTERVTILEAISMAGDITDLGKKDNVTVIREVNGERQVARVNLLSKDVFNSPYFYLKTNDVVYVEPVKARFISRTGVPQYLSIVAVGLSLILTIINLRK
jgi:polysaccharide biosynthesis/export protein